MKKLLFTLLATTSIFCCTAAEEWRSALKEAQAEKNFDAAVKKFDHAMSLAKRAHEKFDIAFCKSSRYRSKRDYKTAIAILESVMKDPTLSKGNLSTGYLVIGQIQWEAKNFAAAEAALKKGAALRAGWASPRCFSTLGRLMQRAKKYSEAEKYFNEALKFTDPGSKAEAWNGLAYIEGIERKNYAKAYGYLDTMDKTFGPLSDRVQDGILLRADLLKRQKKYDEAIKCYERMGSVRKSNPGYVATAYTRAAQVAFGDLKDYPRAKKLIVKSAGARASWGYDSNLAKKIDAALKK